MSRPIILSYFVPLAFTLTEQFDLDAGQNYKNYPLPSLALLIHVHNTHYTLINAVAAVYMTDWALKYMTGGVDSVTCK